MSESNLMPIEQKTVVFYDDEITAVVVALAGGERMVYVPLRPICDYLGLDWSGQRQRINRDPVLADAVSGVVVTPTPLISCDSTASRRTRCRWADQSTPSKSQMGRIGT